jgi:serine/threonine-protein kinase
VADRPDDVSGLIAARYLIDREIGRGGMATVYLARDLRHDAAVAVKVLRPELASLLGGERFHREILISARLQHPNILAVYDSGEHKGLPFYVMPYVEGESLERRLKREGPLPIDDALEIASQVAEALAHAHTQGFVHRDVKPSNILLTHGHALLADFGIARAIELAGSEKLTETGLALGTASYMSPEQAAGDKVDGRTDIYSLGCVLYEMLAGTPPFSGSSPRSVRARHTLDAVPSLRTVRDTVSVDLESAIVRALAKVPADRFPDAAEFRTAIRQTEPAAQMARAMPVQPPPRRRRPRVGLVIAAVLLVVAIGVRFLFQAGPELDPNRIIVFPLLVHPDFTGPRSVGEDVATMIGNALDGTGPLRWIDGWSLLEPDQRDDIRGVPLNELRGIARDHRCAYLVTGRLVSRGDTAQVFIDLRDVRGDSVVANGEGTGSVADAWRPGLLAVNDILPRLVPGVTPDIVAEWRDRNPAAIASFLVGEAAFRRVHLEQALAHYRDAVEADSSFGLAAIRGAQAATWNHRSGEAAALIQIAIRQPLPPRYASFARGYEAYLAGRTDLATAALKQAIDLDPDMAVAWMQLGEVHTHLLAEQGNPDSLAEAAFEQARHLDPTATNLLFHLIEIRLRRGQAAAAEPIVRQFVAAQPDTVLRGQVEIMHTCVRDGPAELSWDQLAVSRPLALLYAAYSLSGAGANPPCSEAAFTALLRNDTAATPEAAGRRYGALKGLQNILLAQGRTDEAAAQIDSAIARWRFGPSLYLLDAPVIDAFRERARGVAQSDSIAYGPAYARAPTNRLWYLGVWEAHFGRPEIARAVARELRARASGGGDQRHLLLASSVEAHATFASGDTASALAMLDALVPATAPGDVVRWQEPDALGAERLLLARLLVARGQFERAIGVANVFDAAWPSIHVLYLPASLELRAGAAAALGDRRLESQFRNRLVALRGDRADAAQ